MRCEAGWVPSTGGDSCPGLGCTNLCWIGIPVQKWSVGCCREELPCTGYFWPHNLSSVSRPWRSNLLREGGALLEPRVPHPSSWGFGEKREKSNCSGKNYPKNAIFNQELSRGDLLHKVLHLCCFLIHFLSACLEFGLSPAAGCTELLEPCPSGCGTEQAGTLSHSGEPQLGIIKASLTPFPAAGPGFYTSGCLNSDLGSEPCWKCVIPCADAIPSAHRGIIFVIIKTASPQPLLHNPQFSKGHFF